jgi:hypothetical protein
MSYDGIYTDIEEMARRLGCPASDVEECLRLFAGDTQSFIDHIMDRVAFWDQEQDEWSEEMDRYEMALKREGA